VLKQVVSPILLVPGARQKLKLHAAKAGGISGSVVLAEN